MSQPQQAEIYGQQQDYEGASASTSTGVTARKRRASAALLAPPPASSRRRSRSTSSSRQNSPRSREHSLVANTDPNAAYYSNDLNPPGTTGDAPPKKKRRRQALSCTECKRRKIKCDRVQPCTPCQRRGEGDRCKWHILEPLNGRGNEKFVTRKEYDEIRDSLTRLQQSLSGPPAPQNSAQSIPSTSYPIDTNLRSQPPPRANQTAPWNPSVSWEDHSAGQSQQQTQQHASNSTSSSSSWPFDPKIPSQSIDFPPYSQLDSQDSRHASRQRSLGYNSNQHQQQHSTFPLPSTSPYHRSHEVAQPLRSYDPVMSVPVDRYHTTSSSDSTFNPYGDSRTPVVSDSFNGSSNNHHNRHQLAPSGSLSSYSTSLDPNFGFPPPPSRPSPHPHSQSTAPHMGNILAMPRPLSGASSHPLPHHSGGRQSTSSPGLTLPPMNAQSSQQFMTELSSTLPSVLTAEAAAAAAHGRVRVGGGGGGDDGYSNNPGTGLDGYKMSGSANGPSSSSAYHNAPTNLATLASLPPPLPPPPPPPPPSSDIPFAAVVGPPRASMESQDSREKELLKIVQTALPRREVCDRLVDYYFTSVEWDLTLLHRPTFIKAYEAFWYLDELARVKFPDPDNDHVGVPNSAGSGYGVGYLGGGRTVSFRRPPLPTASGKQTTNGLRGSAGGEEEEAHPCWIALLMSVLVVALERMGWQEATKLGIVPSVDEFKKRCGMLFDGAQAVLVLVDFSNVKRLEVMQSLVLHTHCQQTLSIAAWEVQVALAVSIATRVGSLIGLGKLTPEKPMASPRPGLLKRELGRRAWWHIIERDWTLAAKLGNVYVVSEAQNFCDLPANVDWEDLEDERRVFVQRQRKDWTMASLMGTKARIARLTRTMIDRFNSPEGVTYEHVLESDKQLDALLQDAPSVMLQPDDALEQTNVVVKWSRLSLSFYLYAHTISMHRPFLVTAYMDIRRRTQQTFKGSSATTSTGSPKSTTTVAPTVTGPGIFSQTAETCLQAAEGVLDRLEEARGSEYPGCQWWQTVMHCYTAAVVLLIDRWYAGTGKAGSLQAEDASERRRKIVTVIEQLRQLGQTTECLEHAAHVLDALLDRCDNRRPRAKKHGRRGLDLGDVIHASNTMPGKQPVPLPRFVKAWIEQPNQPAGGEENQESTNVTGGMRSYPPIVTPMVFSTYPVTAMLVDPCPDAIFWSKIFDMELWHDGEPFEMFFSGSVDPAVAESGGDGVYGGELNDGDGGEGGAASVWDAISGPIGSLGQGDDWMHATYESVP